MDAIKRMVDENGPIHKDHLKRLIAKRFGVRMGRKISGTLDGMVATAVTAARIKIEGDFLWSFDMSSVPLRIQTDGPAQRKIDEIPPEELSLAILKCVTNAVGISNSDLVRETARLFVLRVTTKVSKIIHEIILRMLEDGTLRSQDDKIVVG